MTMLLAEKITEMTLWQCQLPVQSARDHGSGLVANTVDIVVVALTSESGCVGYGEASPWSVFTGTAEANLAALHRYMRPLILHKPISDAQRILRECDSCVVHNSEAKAALETALLDLQGKILGISASTLLGGAVRETIPLSVSLANPDFAADLDLLARLDETGIRIVKLKTGTQGHAFDLMRLERIVEAYPEFDVRVDYNQGLENADALRKLRDIEQFPVSFIEQPLKASQWRQMQRLTQALDVPVMADESVFSCADLLFAIEQKLCDVVSIKIMKAGGIRNAQLLAAVAESAGIPAYGGDMFESGIAHLAGVHMIACSPNITLGCEFYQASFYLLEDLLCEPFPLHEGSVKVPTAPGLGIDIDVDKVRKYAVESLK